MQKPADPIARSRALALRILDQRQAQILSSGKSKKYRRGLLNFKPIEIPEPFGLNYSVGLTARMFTTYLKGDQHEAPGFSAGIVQELGLSKRLFLTNAIRFNLQMYRMDNDVTGVIEKERVNKFPGAQHFENNVTEIKATNRYFDLPLGLKWIFLNDQKSNRYYINPSVVWQWYLPQHFKYTFLNSSSSNTKDKRHFAYLGSFNVEVGVEKYLTRNSSWHLGVWAERSIIPLGVEDERITMVGVSTAFVIGK